MKKDNEILKELVKLSFSDLKWLSNRHEEIYHEMIELKEKLIFLNNQWNHKEKERQFKYWKEQAAHKGNPVLDYHVKIWALANQAYIEKIERIFGECPDMEHLYKDTKPPF